MTTRVGRRGLLLGAAALSLAPRFVFAAEGKYEAMILGCIDPRLQGPVRDYAVKRGLNGKYSQFTIAGAAVGVASGFPQAGRGAQKCVTAEAAALRAAFPEDIGGDLIHDEISARKDADTIDAGGTGTTAAGQRESRIDALTDRLEAEEQAPGKDDATE